MIAVLNERKVRAAETAEVRDAIGTARKAQRDWAQVPIRDRAKRVGRLRAVIARSAGQLAEAAALVSQRPIGEKLTSEVLPLLESARFLAREAPGILRTARFGSRGRPLWLHGSSFEIQRKPFGVVLIVGPANYPLFIPIVQMLHALVAGNAVAIKPAENATAPVAFFAEEILRRSAIPESLVQILPETVEAASDAARFGVDKAIFTGSSENGRDFLAVLAKTNTPSVMELSGADAVFVRADADVMLAAKAIAFGLRLNAGNTCMAPHLIVVHHAIARELTAALRPLGVRRTDLCQVRDDSEALDIVAFEEHGLGAAIFSRSERDARAFADRLATGFVTINDIIVPTADPRFPFGGIRGSGFGVTRGAEGLLEMTYPRPVAIRRARFLPHLDELQESDVELFTTFISTVHGRGLRRRGLSLWKLLRAGRRRMRNAKQQ
ncbi:MAG: aldehyde dehydrogenase family protein [Chthoniobacterales bacterium]|nr:aldehyde dehydrogenase family protein [Chthoniobacterales bacterium]